MSKRLERRLAELREERARLVAAYDKIERTRSHNLVSDEQLDYLLQQQYGGLTREQSLARIDQKITTFERHTMPPERRGPPATALRAIFMVLGLFVGIILVTQFSGIGPSLTGLAVYDPLPVGEESTDGNFTINVTNAEGLSVSGTLRGTGTATLYATIDGGRLLVAEIDGSAATVTHTVWTDKPIYALGETVTPGVVPAPEEVTYYAYLGDNEDGIPFETTFAPEEAGTYALDAIITIDGAVTKVTTTFDVVDVVINGTNETIDTSATNEVPTTSDPETTFTAVCAETCTFPAYTGPINIEVVTTEGSLVLDELVVFVPTENNAPVQTAIIPTVMLVNGTATIDLDSYFSDPDGDALTYEVNNVVGLEERIDGSTLTFTSTIPGTYETYVYASDLDQLVQSNRFTITVPEAEIDEAPNGTNETPATTSTNETLANETLANETLANETLANETLPPVNESYAPAINGTVNCSASDPNLRPVECVQTSEEYFEARNILLENGGRNVVGRFTPIGNLFLKGTYVEGSTATPGAMDYSIGFVDSYGDYTATIWIDSHTGDLHLRGSLTEANTNVALREGMVGITNQRGILVAMADKHAGNLIIRGNVIPYRSQTDLEGET